LRAGVPADLTKAALRRAWTSDPAIRDFIGLAENQWDFTDPASIPGFGPLSAGEDVGGLLAQALGQGLEAAEAEARLEDEAPVAAAAEPAPAPPMTPQVLPQVHGMPERNDTSEDHSVAVEEQQQTVLAAVQHPEPAADTPPSSSRHRHGGALPK